MGGDELTEERERIYKLPDWMETHRKQQKARLDGVFPKNEHWHAVRMAYYVSLKMFFKAKQDA